MHFLQEAFGEAFGARTSGREEAFREAFRTRTSGRDTHRTQRRETGTRTPAFLRTY